MPRYLIDILTGNYANTFLKMSVIKIGKTYEFTYDTGRFAKLDINTLDTVKKLSLIALIMDMNDRNENHLITGSTYLLDRELIYSAGMIINENTIKLMFRPDLTNSTFIYKLCAFTNSILDKNNSKECFVLKKLCDLISSGDDNKVRRYIDKSIERTCGNIGDEV